MTKPKKKWEWQQDFDRVQSVVGDLGGELVKADDAYVAFRFIRDNKRLVFYPYKCPSAFGHMLRVRFEGSGDREALQSLLNTINERIHNIPHKKTLPPFHGYHRRNT